MVHLSPEAFKNMEMLRVFIVISYKCFSGGPTFLPEELRMLDWHNCPLESFPSNFQGKKLIILKMKYSALKSLKGVENFRSLTIMDFSGCEFLEMIPDVSNISNLEDLSLRGCTNLVEVHRSVGFLDKLVKLNLNFCFNLNSFPKRLRLRSLEYLGLYSCSKLNYFPEIECKMERLRHINLGLELPLSIQHASSLINLDLRKSINLTNLLSSIYQLEHLNYLDLGGLKLGKFPEKMGDNKQSMPSIVSKKESEISSCLQLPPLPPLTNSSVSNDGCSSVVFPALITLNLENCFLLESNIFKIFNCSSTLRDLYLSGSDIVTIPACIKRFVCLEILDLNNCKKLREISALPPNIVSVFAAGCTSLETLIEESQLSQLFNTWCLQKLVRVETVFSAPSPMGSSIEPEGSPSSINNITPDRKAHVGVDASTATYQNVQALQTPQPWREPLVGNCFNVSISGNEIPHWFNYREEVSISNTGKYEIDIDVPTDVEGEITGIAFAVAFGTEEYEYIGDLNIYFGVIRGGVKIYIGNRYLTLEKDANHVLMHFHVTTFFKHKVDNDRLRVQFHWEEASNSRFIRSCGFHLIRRYEEKKIDLINDNQVTRRPRVDDGNLESNWYQHQKRHSLTLGSRFSNAEDTQPGQS